MREIDLILFLFPQLSGKTSLSEKYALSTFILETIALKGRLFSDGSSYTSVLLLNCIVEDARKGKLVRKNFKFFVSLILNLIVGKEGRLTRLMERKSDYENKPGSEAESVRSMVDVTFQQKGYDTFCEYYTVYRI